MAFKNLNHWTECNPFVNSNGSSSLLESLDASSVKAFLLLDCENRSGPKSVNSKATTEYDVMTTSKSSR